MPTRTLIRRVWPFFALLLLVYLCSLDSLRFVLDDWCQLPRLAGLLRGEAPGWRGIVDNRWIGNPRIFFLTWLLQGAWAWIWGLDTIIPYYLLGFGAHLCSCLLLYRLLWRAGLRERTAAFVSLACLVTPTSSNALFWINCWQFVLPLAGFLLLAELHVRPLRKPWADLAALCAAAVGTQFLGEQILPVLYAAFAWALAVAWRRPKDGRRVDLLRVLLPAAAAALSLGVYWRRSVAPFFHAANAPGGWSAVWEGVRQSAAMHAAAFTPFSEFYGRGSVSPSPATWGLIAAVALALGWRHLNEGPDPEERAPASTAPFLLAAAAVFILCHLPVMAGVARGLRTAMEYRYTYLSGLALTAALTLALRAAADRWAGPRGARAVAAAEAVLILYLGGLTIYDLRDIWGGQKRLDERIWARIDAQYRPETKFIMTDGQTMATLMPSRSNAISDFGDDFGVTCRLRAKHPRAAAESLYVTRRYQASYDHGDWMYLPAYREIVFRATKDRILAVVFRHGPSYADMLAGQVEAFSDFDAYKRYRSQERIEFVRWELAVPK